MKTILASVFSAVIAGLFLFFAQTWWSDSQSASKQRIRFDRVAVFEVTKSQLQDILKKADDYQNINIGLFKSKNVGKEDIAEISFSAPILSVVGFGSVNFPNANPKNVGIVFDRKVLSVNYKLLPSGADNEFWVASSSSSLGLEFSNDSKGIHVVSDAEKFDEDHPFPWLFLGVMAIIAIVFFVGFWVGASRVSEELKKRGVDAEAIMQQPLTSVSPPPTSP